MEKRVLLAIVISAVFMFAYPHISGWINPPKKTVTVDKGEKSGQPIPEGGYAPIAAAPTIKPAATPQKIKEEIKEEFTRIETPLYIASFTNKGGAITKWELKRHFTPKKDGSRPINLSQTILTKGSLTTSVVINNVSKDLYFKTSNTINATIDLAAGEKKELIYSAVTSEGVIIEKKYIFNAAVYPVEVEITATSAKTNAAGGYAPIGKTVTVINANAAGKDATGYHNGPIINAGKKLIRQKSNDAQMSGSANAAWFGTEDKYFLAVFIPKDNAAVNWTADAGANAASKAALVAPFNLSPGAKVKTAFKAFMGPKEHTLLEAEKAGLEDAIEYGVFSFLAQPSLTALNFFQKYVANYGLAIIILTVIIKIVFYPLTAHSLKSMKEMQKVQPQLLAIREKFKDNKEKLNKEMMELYKRYKINPLGGCLPMVLQIPVFLALYEVLYVAIELRQAPFFLWIMDLSEKDPYYISPILMGATMFLQQKMTPTTADPMQAKIMLFMPVIFTVMFLSFPSGLVIYWLVNNVLSIAQQYYAQRGAVKA
ncbi:MAG: membrane protein insertase YidC [Deltaproteobacteria bacterium]|nr:membrane protein insertase YidC [Deltaproteobacteria bacterium]